MSEPFLNEMSEELEGTEALSREMQELNEMTNEPGSYIEGKVDVAQSEAIESTFNELVETAQEPADNLAESLPLPLPGPKQGPEVSIDPDPIWREEDEVDKVSPEREMDISEASGLPVPLPTPPDADEVELSTAGPAEDLAETLPEPLPQGGLEVTSSTVEGVGDELSGTIPKQTPEGSGVGETVAWKWESEGVDPMPLPGEGDEINMDPDPFSREAGEIESSPVHIPIPDLESRDGLASTLPVPLPGGSMEGSSIIGTKQSVAVFDGSSFSLQLSV